MMSKKRVIVGLIVIIALGGGGWYWHHRHHAQAKMSALPKPKVMLSLAANQAHALVINATGTLIAPQSTNISAQINGYIKSISYHEGQSVQAGTVLFQLDDRHQLAAVASAKATAAMSTLQLKRDQKLRKQGLVLHDALYQAEVTNENNQAALTSAKTALDDTQIRAPFTGIVGAINNSVGDYVTAGATLTTLVNRDQLRVDYAIASKYLPLLKTGQPVILSDPNHPQRTLRGFVSYIDSAVDPTSQTVAVHATLNNQAHLFSPGQYVTVSQTIQAKQATLVVPSQAIIADIDGYHVFTVKAHKAKQVNVTIGRQFGNDTEILKGLRVHQPVVTAGQTNLHDGMAVTVLKTKS